jgi:DNA polymerase-3 subunit epsilon
MVKDAPLFDLISDQVLNFYQIVFVAHNVNFDYSFVRHELERAGKWTAKSCVLSERQEKLNQVTIL